MSHYRKVDIDIRCMLFSKFDELGYACHDQIMALAIRLKVRTSRHRTVIVHDFANDTGRSFVE
jgi:hypothetical protein